MEIESDPWMHGEKALMQLAIQTANLWLAPYIDCCREVPDHGEASYSAEKRHQTHHHARHLDLMMNKHALASPVAEQLQDLTQSVFKELFG